MSLRNACKMNLLLCVGVYLGLLGLSVTVAGQHSMVIYVKTDATGANNGSSWTDAISDLQTALATAISGDEIWVAVGSYRPAGPVDLAGRGSDHTAYVEGMRMASFHLKSGVALYGGFAGEETDRQARDPKGNKTLLSGDLNGNDRPVKAAVDLAEEDTRSENSFHVVTATGADDTAILDGFIITGGYARGTGHDNGGGMINIGQPSREGPTLIDCRFEWNFAFRNGGGIYNARSDLNLIRCTFLQNHAHIGGQEPQSAGIGGGGLHTRNSDPRLFDCSFSLNTTLGQGGGMLNFNSSPIVIGCQFDSNHLLGGANRNTGGGLWMGNAGTPLFLNSSFIGNSAAYGGGAAAVNDVNPSFVNTIFSGNVASGSGKLGAGFYINTRAKSTLINCTFGGNVNAGSTSRGGAGLFSRSSIFPILRNCVFWGNVSGGMSDRAAQIAPYASVPDVAYSCVQGGWDQGVGNIDLDPLFLDADGPDDIIGTADDDLRLAPSSPCIDTGESLWLPADSADLDGDGDTAEAIPVDLSGNPRVRGSWIDMGAYEYELAVTAGGPSPIDRADDISRDVVLAWEPGVSAQTHNVYLGTSWDDVDAATPDTIAAVGLSQETHSLDVGALAFDQTYYWRVDEVNGSPDYTEFKGATWSFTTEPFAYPITPIAVSASSTFGRNSGPEKTIDGSGLVDDLHGVSASDMWISGGIPATIEYTFDRTYKLHELWVWNSNQLVEAFLGFGAKEVVIEHSLNGMDWVALEGFTQLAQAPGLAGYALNNVIDFKGVMASAVRITINSAHGFAPQSGLSEVQFFHVPVLARQPQPAMGATTQSLDTVLSWRPGREADLHEVLFSENRDAVEDGSALIATTTDPWLDLSDLNLQYGTTYYWKVNEVNALENPPVHEGDVWSFTTPEFSSIDGVE